MPKCTWKFSISYYFGREQKNIPNSIGFSIETAEEVESLGKLFGLAVAGQGQPTAVGRRISVELDENDPTLHRLLAEIAQRYGFRPSAHSVIPSHLRDKTFGVKKWRTFTSREIDATQLLLLEMKGMIAHQAFGTVEQARSEVYLAKADASQRSKTQCGFLSPFFKLAIDSTLKRELEKSGIRGLSLDPVIIVPPEKAIKPLWKLSSSRVMPKLLNPVVNEAGNPVQSGEEWPKYIDGGAYLPEELRYRRDEVGDLDFDIAVTCERVGIGELQAARLCIVTQKFRRELKRCKVRGPEYTPVVLV